MLDKQADAPSSFQLGKGSDFTRLPPAKFCMQSWVQILKKVLDLNCMQILLSFQIQLLIQILFLEAYLIALRVLLEKVLERCIMYAV